MTKKSLKQDLISAIRTYVEKGYAERDEIHSLPANTRISIFFLFGYLHQHLTKKDRKELNEILNCDTF